MKKASEKALSRQDLQQIASRLRLENEALLNLIRKLNEAGTWDDGKNETNKPKK